MAAEYAQSDQFRGARIHLCDLRLTRNLSHTARGPAPLWVSVPTSSSSTHAHAAIRATPTCVLSSPKTDSLKIRASRTRNRYRNELERVGSAGTARVVPQGIGMGYRYGSQSAGTRVDVEK